MKPQKKESEKLIITNENDILRVLKSRRSVRKYTSQVVAEDLLDRIVEAGLYAPTGMNRQAVIILKITDQATVRQLGHINGTIMGTGNDAFYGAPAVLCVLARRDNPTGLYDGCAVITNMLMRQNLWVLAPVGFIVVKSSLRQKKERVF